MLKKGFWVLFVFLAVTIALLATIPFFIEDKFGIMNFKTDELLGNKIWRFGLFTHIISGGIALLIGWFLFVKKWRNKYLSAHRRIGKIYVLSALTASLSGIFIGFYATGGLIAAAGFICLGSVWFYSTFNAYRQIKNRRIIQHETMMIYSYSLCFAAVTLRVYLPLTELCGIDFITAYKFIAWFCWMPNLLIAYSITKRPPFFKNAKTSGELNFTAKQNTKQTT